MQIPTEMVYELDAAMEQWTDGRVILEGDLEDLLMFLLYVPRALSQSGVKFLGFSCRQRAGQTLLTVKLRDKDVPLVVFVTGPSTIGSMGRFVSLLEQEKLTYVKDKYPWN